VGYRNARSGVEHGAYGNVYDWKNITLFNNGGVGGSEWIQHNVSGTGGVEGRYTVRDITVDGNSQSAFAMDIVDHAVPPSIQSLFLRWTVKNYTSGDAIRVNETQDTFDGQTVWATYDFVNWTIGTSGELESTDFQLIRMNPGSVYRIQRRAGTAYKIVPHPGNPTSFDITTISAFWP
jgi:hypothetical protein